MLKSLQVKNYVLIDSLDIEFPAGLIIITGQTGAGKSIMLGALSLVLGGKADPSMIGGSSDNCVVEAVFKVENDDAAKELVEENGWDWNGGELTIRRVLSRSGRSRCFVNDEPVGVSVLSGVADRLLDIHSQHSALLLKDSRFQLSMLDHYAGNIQTLDKCKETFRALVSMEKRLAELSLLIEKASQERDYNQAVLQRIEAANLKAGEVEELEAEQKQLANAEEIKASLFQAMNLLSNSGLEETADLNASLKDAVKLLSKAGAFIPAASELSSRLESARLEINDINQDVARMEASVDVSAERLEAVDNRLALIYELLNRNSCRTVEELIALRDSLSGSLFDSARLEDEKNSLMEDVEDKRKEVDALCETLREGRKKSLGGFVAEIQASIRGLELERAVFDVEMSEAPLSSTGKDAVRFLFSASGKNPIEVSKCASGGELSRIMLCLKAMMAKYANMPSMVFDEIDTGVSGSVADKMGSMICSMGNYMQVFAITHLPQVAAKGEAHYLVSKEISSGDNVRTSIKKISGKERVMEVARMLSGSAITPEAVANAEALIG